MRTRRKHAFAALALACAGAIGGDLRAEPLLTQGIGLQSCAKLAPNLKPGAGLDHLPNALLFCWFQGYLSAANVYLLNEYSDYVDIGAVDEATITQICFGGYVLLWSISNDLILFAF